MGARGAIVWSAAGLGALALAGICLVAWSAETTPARQAPAPALEGRTFLVEVIDEKGRKRPDDRLIFRSGTFHSERCIPYGFSPSPYWIRTEGDRVHFLAETVSPENGTMVWQGTVAGDRLQGGYLWTKERWYWTIRRRYNITGSGER